MTVPVLYKIRNHSVWLSSERTLYWEEEKALIISDLHLGKTGHFRKAGIPVPQSVYKEDLQRMVVQIQHYQPDKLVIVGDLFHSKMNKELDLFKKWRSNFSQLDVLLVKGNHDILTDSWYQEAGIELYDDQLTITDFTFIHDIGDRGAARENYFFSGHIHPGIRLKGTGKQSLQFPCFYFTEDYCVIPAFSRFTGTYSINPQRNETVFAIVEKSIVQLQ
jgi:DNA ligase-associated metallophosphoesterase